VDRFLGLILKAVNEARSRVAVRQGVSLLSRLREVLVGLRVVPKGIQVTEERVRIRVAVVGVGQKVEPCLRDRGIVVVFGNRLEDCGSEEPPLCTGVRRLELESPFKLGASRA